MKKLLVGLIISGLLIPLAGVAVARGRNLWESDDFRLSARLQGGRLRLTESNLTDYPLRFRCRLSGLEAGARQRMVRGRLTPGEVDRSNLRGHDRFPDDTTCRVTVDTSATVMASTDDFVVLAEGATQANGSPQTTVWFYNKTGGPLHITCAWWFGVTGSVELVPQVWSPELNPYGTSGLSLGGVPIDTLTDFACARYEQGVAFPISVPTSIETLFDSGTFLVTKQTHPGGYYMRFINRLDVAVVFSCTWTDTASDGTVLPGSTAANLHAFGITGLSSGSQTPITTSGMTCDVSET